MISVKQTRVGGPEFPPEKQGNCYAACVASVLELPLEKVPDMPDGDTFYAAWQTWFRERGLYRVELAADDGEGDAFRPPGWSIGRGEMPGGRDYDHALVCRDGVAVFDPSAHLTRNDPKAYRIVSYEVLVPMDPSSARS